MRLHTHFICSLLAFLLFSPALKAQTFALYATVEDLRVREAPDLQAATIHKMYEGEMGIFLNEVTLETEKITLRGITYEEPWVKIQVQGGKKGWVYGGAVRFYKPGTTVTPVFSQLLYSHLHNLSVRKFPDVDAQKIGSLKEGERLTFLGKQSPKTEQITLRNVKYQEPWIQVVYGRYDTGWVYAGGIRLWEVQAQFGAWESIASRSLMGKVELLDELLEFNPRNALSARDYPQARLNRGEAKVYLQNDTPFDPDYYGNGMEAWFYGYLPLSPDYHALLIFATNEECCSDYWLMTFASDGKVVDQVSVKGGGGDGGWWYERSVEPLGEGKFEVIDKDHETDFSTDEERVSVEERITLYEIGGDGKIVELSSETSTYEE